jgi:hypothetical protein
VRVVVGIGFLFLALVMWRRGQRRHSLPLRWLSLAQVALALSTCFAAVACAENNSCTSDPWWALQYAALLPAVCAGVVAGVYGVRETQRGSGLQR